MAAAVEFFGEKGDPGISISFGKLRGEYARVSVDTSGRGEVTFDLKKIASGNRTSTQIAHSMGMRAVHEGDHGVRIVKYGHPGSRNERYQREVLGYRVEGYYQKATGYLQNSNNIWAPWNLGDGIDEKSISNRAAHSVDFSCAGSTEGSCQ